MNKEQRKKLLEPFPKEVVQDPPKGKFGKFVNHAVYVERLRDSEVDYEWEFEPVIVGDNIVGAVGKLTIDGKTYMGAGDVENSALQRATKGECLKLAESDAFKRASMRAGIGVELWSGTDDFYVDDTPVKEAKAEKKPKPEPKKEETTSDMKRKISTALQFHEPDVKLREMYKNTAWKSVSNKDVDSWTEEEYETFLDSFVEAQQNTTEQQKQDKAIIDEIFDSELISEEMKCPECGKTEVVDNREKKEQDPEKLGKIRDFACQKPPYGIGCGKGWWINNAPESWL